MQLFIDCKNVTFSLCNLRVIFIVIFSPIFLLSLSFKPSLARLFELITLQNWHLRLISNQYGSGRAKALAGGGTSLFSQASGGGLVSLTFSGGCACHMICLISKDRVASPTDSQAGPPKILLFVLSSCSRAIQLFNKF